MTLRIWRGTLHSAEVSKRKDNEGRGLEGRRELETQLGEKQHAAVWTGRHREGSLDDRANVWTITKSNRDVTQDGHSAPSPEGSACDERLAVPPY